MDTVMDWITIMVGETGALGAVATTITMAGQISKSSRLYLAAVRPVTDMR